MKLVSNIFGWLGNLFYPDLSGRRSQARGAMAGDRRKIAAATPKRNTFLNSIVWLLIVIGVVASALSFVYAVNFFSTALKRLESNPLVVNLSNDGLKANVTLGETKEPCSKLDSACWLHPKYDDSAWEKIVLPELDIKALKNYQNLIGKGNAYYRITLNIPESLINLKDEIAFTSMYINHDSYKVYINGELNYVGNGSLGNYPIIPIDRSMIDPVTKSVSVQVSGELSATAIGIRHRGALYLGPKSDLDSLTTGQERSIISFYLLFLLSKGSIFVIFSLFFFFSRNRAGLAYFLVFVFFTTVENLYPSGILITMLSEKVRILLLFSGQAIAFSALLAFYGEFYQSSFVARIVRYFLPISVLLSLYMSYDFNWGRHFFSINHLFLVSNIEIGFVTAVGVIAGFIKYRVLRKFEASESVIFSTKLLSHLSLAYLCLIVWEFGFNEYKGFDLRSLFDLGYFYFVAFLTAREFGFNEKRVVTFDAIKKEKDRMQQELQEASLIAKTFLPGRPPEWADYNISVFHEPMTESSGDWFAFVGTETSAYKHFIMCDVTGHGVQAALIVSACKTAVSMLEKTDANRSDFIAEYAKQLNSVLFQQGEGRQTTTFIGLTFEKLHNKVHYYTAAHPPPLIMRKDRKFDLLVNRQQPLGMTAEIQPNMQSSQLESDDILIVYSDGITLGTNRRLIRYVLDQDMSHPTNLAGHCIELVRAYELKDRGFITPDDTTMICFKKTA